ncbi:MAG: asnB [Candidatus Berkelbacteria bacterium]|nr:asnB [Candidatus Berkelbacteria bacterium]
MCGIVGIIKFDKKPVDKNILQELTDTLSHRGPDDEGIFIDNTIGLGHRRLSIIDLSPLGHQPMFYNNNNLAIVFNGEIYNYLEIKNDLEKSGYKFKSESDTEVILAAYKKWGEKCLERFNGMWAFILFDKKRNQIFIARDRLGVKPVYYYHDKDKFIVGSEIKALLKYPEIKIHPNEKIVWDYLITGWLDYSDETFFKGIKELRGGHYILIKNKNIIIKKYWDLSKEINSRSPQENINKFQGLFFDAIRLRLRSDVPIGTCLSGGLDSSAIVCAINRFLRKEKFDQIGSWQKTFSAIYGKDFPKADEQKYITEVIKKTEAKSFSVTPSAKKLKTEVENLIYHQDQPVSTTSIYAQWNVFRLAQSKKIKVMLDGQGADELLAGYTGYFGIYFLSLIKRGKIITFLRELYFYLIKHPDGWSELREVFSRALKAGWLGSKAASSYQGLNPQFKIFNDNFLNKFHPVKRKKIFQDDFKNSLYHSLMMNLSSLLRYEDRNSMAFAIESRVPFLDYRLVEFVFGLPNSYKIRNGETKWIMRQALKGLLPPKIIDRQDKIGFATPEEYWLKNDLKNDLFKVFKSSSFQKRGYFDSEKVVKLYQDYLDNKFSDGQLFWRLYCLEIWLRIFID